MNDMAKNLLLWLIIAVVLLTVFQSFNPRGSGTQDLAYSDFMDKVEHNGVAEVLVHNDRPATIEAKFETQYATDPWYVHLYRTSHAYHGVHPFYMWYWASHAMDHVDDVVWVGASRKAVERMGFRAASSLSDALEMVSHTVGRNPSITYLHNPPHLIADVR